MRSAFLSAQTGSFFYQVKNDKAETTLIEMKDVWIPSTKSDFVPFYQTDGKQIFPLWVEIERIDI
ncbi:MAG: hypothetical protein WAW07_02350 [Bacteroidales bacterium]